MDGGTPSLDANGVSRDNLTLTILLISKMSVYLTFKFDVHRAVHRNTISIVKPTRCTNVSNLFYFWNDTLHVSDGFSVHHQQFKTVHTRYSNRHLSNRYCCLLASKQTAVSV